MHDIKLKIVPRAIWSIGKEEMLPPVSCNKRIIGTPRTNGAAWLKDSSSMPSLKRNEINKLIVLYQFYTGYGINVIIINNNLLCKIQCHTSFPYLNMKFAPVAILIGLTPILRQRQPCNDEDNNHYIDVLL